MMIEFVNAKINIGLQVTRRREDGYHDLQTVFYPVGSYSGTHWNPAAFCDILECCVSEAESHGVNSAVVNMPEIILSGRRVDCPLEKNLVYKAAKVFFEETGLDASKVCLRLEKHLPDGAGMGGGSADAAFTLRMLSEYFCQEGLPLESWATRLGADCPFFIKNKPAYAEGIGEILEPIAVDLSGHWLAVVKPDVYISTKEAFANICPKPGEYDLRMLPSLPMSEWRHFVKNDFEDSIFPAHPEIRRVKELLYDAGSQYASMTGSGSCVYGIFTNREDAEAALSLFSGDTTIAATYLLKM